MSELNDGDAVPPNFTSLLRYTPTQRLDGTTSTIKRVAGTNYAPLIAGSETQMTTEGLVGTSAGSLIETEVPYVPINFFIKGAPTTTKYIILSRYFNLNYVNNYYNVQRYSLSFFPGQAANYRQMVTSYLLTMNPGEFSKTFTFPARTITIQPYTPYRLRGVTWDITWSSILITLTRSGNSLSIDWGTSSVSNSGETNELLQPIIYEGYVGFLDSSYFGPYTDSGFSQSMTTTRVLGYSYNTPIGDTGNHYPSSINDRTWTFWNDYSDILRDTGDPRTSWPAYLVRAGSAVRCYGFLDRMPDTTSSAARNYYNGNFPTFQDTLTLVTG